MIATAFPVRLNTISGPELKTVKRKKRTPISVQSADCIVSGFIDGFPQFAISFTNSNGVKFSGVWDSRRPLLSANSKLKKLPGKARKYRAIGCAMAPFKFASSAHNLCTWATAGCVEACNGLFAGMNVTPSTRFALIGRARLYLEFRELFKAKLREEVRKFVKLCKRTGVIPAIRLNVSSDIVWEKIFPELFAEFPEVCWYDYSKALPKHRPTLPANYTIAHSYSEKTTFADVESIFAAGRNIIVAFDSAYNPQRHLFGALPKSVVFRCKLTGRELVKRVFNADRQDIRIAALDGIDGVGGLHGKSGNSRVESAIESGFMIRHPEGATLRAQTIFDGVVTIEC
jgi:hypothetical protein